MNNLITIREFAAKCGVSYQAIAKRIRLRKMPFMIMFGVRVIDLNQRAVKKYLSRHNARLFMQAGIRKTKLNLTTNFNRNDRR